MTRPLFRRGSGRLSAPPSGESWRRRFMLETTSSKSDAERASMRVFWQSAKSGSGLRQFTADDLRWRRSEFKRAACSNSCGHLCFVPKTSASCVPAEVFDGAFSNFGALNCVEDLAQSLDRSCRSAQAGRRSRAVLDGSLLRVGDVWYLGQGEGKKRFAVARGRSQRRVADGAFVRVRYPTVRSLARAFAPKFRVEVSQRYGGRGSAQLSRAVGAAASAHSSSLSSKWIRCRPIAGIRS